MTERTTWTNPTQLAALNDNIRLKDYVDREDILAFLRLVETSDGNIIVEAIRTWLSDLNADPSYQTVTFPQEDIDAITGDLDAYGLVQSDTILRFKESSSRNLL